jgi:ParB family chromosome partitioning protein
VIRGQLNVRATEALVRAGQAKGKANGKGAPASTEKSSSIRDLEARLARALGTKVEVRDHDNKGEIAVPYVDLDHLDRILAKLL